MDVTYSYYTKNRKLEDNEIFVFGSNAAGRHGKGAALLAFKRYGAKYGKGVGMVGNHAYAIPTKDHDLEVMDLRDIVPHIHAFVQHTKEYPHLRFYVTPIGCGLAGYTAKDIAPHFKGAINCSFEISFAQYLDSN